MSFLRSTPFDDTVVAFFPTDQVNPHLRKRLYYVFPPNPTGRCGTVRCGFSFLMILRWVAVRIFDFENPTVRCGAVIPHRTALHRKKNRTVKSLGKYDNGKRLKWKKKINTRKKSWKWKGKRAEWWSVTVFRRTQYCHTAVTFGGSWFFIFGGNDFGGRGKPKYGGIFRR